MRENTEEIYLLFHGRHIVHTREQEKLLWEVLNTPVGKLDLFGQTNINPEAKITHVVFAITSANKSNSRFNPLPLHLRAIGVDRFFTPYRENLCIGNTIVPIPHFNPTDKYVEILTKEIKNAENIALAPTNTIVLASTPGLINLYQRKGFAVLTGEYDMVEGKYKCRTPGDVVKRLSESANWAEDSELRGMLAGPTNRFWQNVSSVPKLIQDIWTEPLLTDSGSLTETRDYSTYAIGMSHKNLLEVKYNDIRKAITTGKIVDEGCADGALMTCIARDFPDADLIGIEITSEFLALCHERQRRGEFGGAFTFFHQRNLMKPIFEQESIDSTICNSTTHEIWSYGDGHESLKNYIKLKYDQTRVGGKLIIRDVVGPENKDKEVYLKLSSEDGSNDIKSTLPESQQELAKYLKGLSTKARFHHFADYYLRGMRQQGKRGPESILRYRLERFEGEIYTVLSLKDATEFITKKDYVDNFHSELNEEFAFFSFTDWKELIKSVGFSIIENPNDPEASSHVYTNEWVVKNRYEGKVGIFEMVDNKLVPVEYPPTNVVLIAEKLN